MNKLQEWTLMNNKGKFSRRGSNRVTELAVHLGITQPAVTKIINGGESIRYKYAKQIMEFTGLSAVELFPEWAEIFGFSEIQQTQINKMQKQELAKLKNKLQKIIDSIE